MRRYFCGLKLIDLYFFILMTPVSNQPKRTHRIIRGEISSYRTTGSFRALWKELGVRMSACLPACPPPTPAHRLPWLGPVYVRRWQLVGAARLAGSSHSGRVIAIIAAHEERPVATRYRPDPCGPSISYRACCGGALSYLSDSRHRRIIHSRLHLHHRPAAGLASLSSAARVR
jgi:hypothetical protein